MKNVIIVLMMVISSIPAFGKLSNKLPVKWGKITAAEFSVKPDKSDVNASAIVLCDFGDIEITNRTFYMRHTRIKILNENGLQYASVEIPYQTKKRHDVFFELKAQTLVFENGKIIKYKVTPAMIEDIKINDRWSKKKFTFPKVSPGVIIEYQYSVASLDFEKLDTWYFQREIPTLWSEIRFEVPPPFIYLMTFENNRELEADEQIKYGEQLQWLYSTKDRKRHFQLAEMGNLLFNTGENLYKVWALNNMTKKIVMKNLPGLSAQAHTDNIQDVYPQVRFDLFESSGNLPRSFRPLLLTTHSNYENLGDWSLIHNNSEFIGYIHFRLKTWTQFTNDLLENERFGQYLMRSVDRINSFGDDSELSRVNKIYQFVKEQFTWNGRYANMAGQDFKDFIENKTGSSAELNLILVNLFRQHGIKSDPVLIRTTDLGMPEKMFPVKNQFNHVIASAEIGGKIYLFDATSDSRGMNKLNNLDIGTYGWKVNNDSPGWIEIFSDNEIRESTDEVPVIRL